MRPQLGQAAVLRALCVSVAALSRPSAGTEAGARLASRALQLLLCHVRGERGLSVCLCCGDAVGAGLASSGLPCVEDGCRQVQVQCSWSSSAHLSVCVPLRLREPVVVWPSPMKGYCLWDWWKVSLPCWLSPCCRVGIVVRVKQMFCVLCRVAPLVEHCDTCMWLLSAWCWLVVSSGEVLLEFFSVGSGGSEVSLELSCVCFWLLLRCPLG
ncbi:hypothetical protein Taro_054288 [Colocasia esculenta]|uniref:Secreted protein n=1 Tax=Colocasia esculenta TaxID=4460 RepID=A0A843XQ10_COLES|nr:hypothetical protein [Colocasia esculenta]